VAQVAVLLGWTKDVVRASCERGDLAHTRDHLNAYRIPCVQRHYFLTRLVSPASWDTTASCWALGSTQGCPMRSPLWHALLVGREPARTRAMTAKVNDREAIYVWTYVEGISRTLVGTSMPIASRARASQTCFGARRGRDRSGLDLGLAISHKAVKAIGGDIHTRNLPGKGCIFAIELPIATL